MAVISDNDALTRLYLTQLNVNHRLMMSDDLLTMYHLWIRPCHGKSFGYANGFKDNRSQTSNNESNY